MGTIYQLAILALLIFSCGQVNDPLSMALLPLEPRSSSVSSPYLIGTGKGDITGPATGVQMMGYVDATQTTAGIHQRLFARATIVADGTVPHRRVVLVNTDLCQVHGSITYEVLVRLREKFGELYGPNNTMIAANHTHSGPGNYSHFTLYNLMYQFAHNQSNFNAIVEGITQAIEIAHIRLVPGQISYATGELSGFTLNRSKEAYERNPDKDQYDSDVDQMMTQFRFDSAEGKPLGLANWFAVHAVSMKKDNQLTSGDNKGYASYKLEKEYGEGFVATFFAPNSGDVSPNVAKGEGNNEWRCPLGDSYECTKWHGDAQANKAQYLFHKPEGEVHGPVGGIAKYVDMSNIELLPQFVGGRTGQTTCPAAIGISMLAGAEDGRGVGFEGITCSGLPPSVRAIACRPIRDCHGEKPTALLTGYKKAPWSPQVLPLQIIRLGQFALIALPGEFTTMAGRRLRSTVADVVKEMGISQVIFTGYANSYAGYVATPEEYQLQHYEGASTHFGPWTLPAYRQEMESLARDLAETMPGTSFGDVPLPLDIQTRIQPPPAIDRLPVGKRFGEVALEVKSAYQVGDQVNFEFWGSNLSHDLKLGGTYMEVQGLVNGEWQTLATDDDWNTKVFWLNQGIRISKIRLQWVIPPESVPGQYRLTFKGKAKVAEGKFTEYTSTSNAFHLH